MHRSAGFTLVELLIVMAIVGILASISVAGYRHARVVAAESTAVSALRSINQGQFLYLQTCGRNRWYAPTLATLGIAAPGTDRAFLSPDLTISDPLHKTGYVIAMAGTPVPEEGPTCNGASPVSSYKVTADPVNPGTSGRLFFGTNTDRVVYSDTVTFTGDMPESGAPPHGSEVK